MTTPILNHDEMVQAVKSKSHHIVDVREPGEYAAGHVPGAINHPLSQFDPAALPAGKPVVLICQAGGRSLKALQASLETGVKNISHYSFGTGGWRNFGGEIET